MSRVRVYWFDDSGRGQCRIPADWQLFYRDSDGWTPVATNAAYGSARDPYNQIDFTGVQTTALRLEVQLLDNFSGGILEWRVE